MKREQKKDFKPPDGTALTTPTPRSTILLPSIYDYYYLFIYFLLDGLFFQQSERDVCNR
jgi:hypothetical protein